MNVNMIKNEKKKKKSGKKPKKASSVSSNSPMSYQVSVPVASGRVRVANKPKVMGLSNGDCVISHREYITDIAGSVAFTANSFSVNPGLPGTFPWLSALAQRYESYLLEELRFCYESQSATSATGTVILALDYDASDAAPTTKSQAMTYRSSVRSPPWSDSCQISLKEDLSKLKSFYSRNGALAANLDVKTYDVGSLFVCTEGQANGNAVGELYVQYKIRLMTPQAGPIEQGEAISGKFSGTVNTAPFGAITLGNMPVVLVSTGSTTSVSTFTFSQPWQGIAALNLVGTGLAGVTPSGTATSQKSWDVTLASALGETALVKVTADIGQTLILTIADTTISAGTLFFGQTTV